MVKTSDFESENSGSSPGEASNWSVSGAFVVTLADFASDFGTVRGPEVKPSVSSDERAALRALSIIETHNLGISADKATELATSIAAGIALDVDWYDIERLMSGNNIVCDGYCHSDDW